MKTKNLFLLLGGTGRGMVRLRVLGIFMANAAIPFEWFFETLNKRVSQGIKIEDLFLCVPVSEEIGEAEFEYEIPSVFKHTKHGIVSQGNNLTRDYPILAKLVNESNKQVKIRVFFISYDRLKNPLILWHKKYPYPKVNQVKGHLILTESQVRREINKLNAVNLLTAKYN